MEATPLRIEIAHGTLHLGARTREFMDKRLEKLDARTSRFPDRSCHIAIARHDRDGDHDATITLELPAKKIVGHAKDASLITAFDRALHRVVRQLTEFKAMLRRDHLHREARIAKHVMPEVAEHDLGEGVEARDAAIFRAHVADHLDQVRHFIRREVALLKRRHPGLRLTVDDLVEDVVMAAIENFPRKPHSLPLESWLYGVASDVLIRRSEASFFPTSDTSPMQTVPEPPDENEGFDGLHRLLFYTELDKEVRGERVEEHASGQPLMNAAADPAAVAETDEIKERISAVLAELPRSWRSAFALHYLEGFDYTEAAQILNETEDSLRFKVRSAEQFLRERLKESAP